MFESKSKQNGEHHMVDKSYTALKPTDIWQIFDRTVAQNIGHGLWNL